uniref:Uncharacterized protein n=1 Tax=Chenopodium quinoa TaxID=63459 RepID=A0A803LJ42_CHEQI
MYYSKKEWGMGFRNMNLFNAALLAKQGWHILTYTDSLMTKVLKGKYFPNANFLDAKVSPAARYTWKSICSAREVLRKGVRRMIGVSESVDIYRGPWVPTLLEFRVRSVNREDRQGPNMVKELLTDGCWGLEVLQNLSSRDEVEAITKIPVLMFNSGDFLSWNYGKNGDFFSQKCL